MLSVGLHENLLRILRTNTAGVVVSDRPRGTVVCVRQQSSGKRDGANALIMLLHVNVL